MKIKQKSKSSHQLRHSPLGTVIDKPNGKLKAPKISKISAEDESEDISALPPALSSKIYKQAKDQIAEMDESENEENGPDLEAFDESDDESASDEEEEDGSYEGEELVDIDENFVTSTDLPPDEEAVVQKFLHAGLLESRSLADIIMEKLRDKEEEDKLKDTASVQTSQPIPDKVIEVYTAVGKMLHHYKSGKLPKALKMLPHLRHWEHVLWFTRPDLWTPAATYACTRIFASNLNEKMAQRFFNLVLLEKCRDDIRNNNKLSYYYYLAIRKALFKPAAFYKGVLLPLVQSRTCSLREATIIGSALTKLSIPSIHSAAVLLRLVQLPYSPATSLFVKLLLNKKYALPRRVIDAMVDHFCSFEGETRILPVLWHQSLLIFAQRYKLELSDEQKERMKILLRAQQHYQITQEVRRELFFSTKNTTASVDMNI